MGERVSKLFKGKPVFWIIVLALVFISVIEVFSATSRMSFKLGNYWQPVTSHAIHLAFGLVIMFIVQSVPYRFFKALPYILLPVAFAMLAVLLIKGTSGHDAERWLKVGFVRLQPSELAKMGVIMTDAWLLSRLDVDDELSQMQTFSRVMIISGVFILMIMPENLSTAVLLAVVVYAMMYIAEISHKYLLWLGGICAGIATIMLLIMLLVPPETVAKLPLPDRFSTWQARVLDHFNKPELSPRDYVLTESRDKPQETHANIAIATSNILGKGPGNSTERDFLQEASCDFIYAIIIEELGVIGGVVVLLLYLWFLLKSGGVASACGTKRYPKFIVMGSALLIFLQALINMSVAVGLIPVTGQPLPLISWGGTSILITSVYFGMIMSISWSGLEPESESAPAQTEEAYE